MNEGEQKIDLTDLKERVALCETFSTAERAIMLGALGALDRFRDVVFDMTAPPNRGGAVNQIFAYLSVDDGGEGLVASAVSVELPICPLVSYRRETANHMRPYAMLAARTTGKVVRLAKFTKRENLEIIRP